MREPESQLPGGAADDHRPSRLRPVAPAEMEGRSRHRAPALFEAGVRGWIRRPTMAGAAITVAAVLLAQIVIASGLVSPFLVASPLQVAAHLPRLVLEEGLLPRTVTTAGEVVLATAIAAGIGGSLGWLLYRFPHAWRAFAGSLASLNAIPLILVYPLLLVVFGRSPVTVVVLGALSALPPLALKTREAFAAVPPVLLDVARCFNLTRSQRFRLVHLPAAAPVMAAGFRIGVSHALAAVIGAEFLTGIGGLGALVPDLADQFDLPEMYGALAFIVVLSAAFMGLGKRVERWLRPR